jgi:hypothetical protein
MDDYTRQQHEQERQRWPQRPTPCFEQVGIIAAGSRSERQTLKSVGPGLCA